MIPITAGKSLKASLTTKKRAYSYKKYIIKWNEFCHGKRMLLGVKSIIISQREMKRKKFLGEIVNQLGKTQNNITATCYL